MSKHTAEFEKTIESVFFPPNLKYVCLFHTNPPVLQDVDPMSYDLIQLSH